MRVIGCAGEWLAEAEAPVAEDLAEIEATYGDVVTEIERARRSMYDAPLLSVSDERELFAAYRAARTPAAQQHLRDRLILANTRLVRKMAERIAHNTKLRSMSVEDLEIEGQFGVMTAIERFDVGLGYKFSTYATWWIYQAIMRAIEEQDPMIRIASWRVQETKRQKRATGAPEAMESAARASVPGKRDSTAPASYTPLPYTVSLDVPLDPTSDNPETTTLLAILSDTVASESDAAETQPQSEQAISRMTDHSALYQALGKLDARERLVIELRFGLTDHQDRTLAEVGRVMGISRERARQIEARALRVLRACLVQMPDGDVLVSHLIEWRLATLRTLQSRGQRARAARNAAPAPITSISMAPARQPQTATLETLQRQYA